ncbi:UDP-N-acetylglucosamine 2-epimerase, partial [Photobacterium leiognathi]|uniref:UDP-N-acetylglucosamine 2-epimerase n=1 Tax=Photobacterium leiognathi TaxID=553611 RepID=UPI002738C9DD
VLRSVMRVGCLTSFHHFRLGVFRIYRETLSRFSCAASPTISQAIKKLTILKPELRFVLAVHPNPTVKQAVMDNLSDVENLSIVEPLDYLALQQTLASSVLTMTDSGGIQEEAPTYGTPVVILRETTERPEALNLGLSILAGADDSNRIVDAALTLLSQGKSEDCVNPYGKGDASALICKRVQEF